MVKQVPTECLFIFASDIKVLIKRSLSVIYLEVCWHSGFSLNAGNQLRKSSRYIGLITLEHANRIY